MASSNEDGDRPRKRDDASNPFIAFRRFADEQISNLLHGVFGLASSHSSDQRMKDYQAWLKEARESRHRLDRQTEESDRIMDLYTKAHKEGQDPAQEEIQRAIQSDSEIMQCPYRPADADLSDHPGSWTRALTDAARTNQAPPATLGSCFSDDSIDDSFANGRHLGMTMPYILFGPYSPRCLEQEQALRDQGVDWREAFEDLLALQTGRSMPSEETHRQYGTYEDWTRDMAKMLTDRSSQSKDQEKTAQNPPEVVKGILADILNIRPWPKEIEDTNTDPFGPRDDALPAGWEKKLTPFGRPYYVNCDTMSFNSQRPHVRGQDETFVDDEAPEAHNNEGTTELDIYEHVLSPSLSNAFPKTAARSIAHLQHDSTPADNASKKPSILSTLTTTERTTLQDGTVHTKTVLKKRFSDGREESTETMHTQNALPELKPKAAQETVKNPKAADNEQKSRGWFWS